MSRASPLIRMLFSAWLAVVFLLYSAVMIPVLSLAVAVYSLSHSRRHTFRLFRVAIRWYGWGIIYLLPLGYFRVRFTDQEPSQSISGCVVVMNHRSSSDPFLVAALGGELVQVVNIWPLRLPVLGFFARAAGYLSIREMLPEEFLEGAARLLSEGVAVVAFPEGTRSGSREMGSFHGTVFRLALQAGVPIVPVCISGNERIPPKGSLLFEPGEIRICKLPALQPATFAGWDAFHLKQHVRGQLAAGLAELDAAG